MQVALDGGMKGTLVQLDFSAALVSVSHRRLLHKLRFIGIGRQFWFIVSQFLSDRKQHVRLDGKISVSVAVVSGVAQDSVLIPLLSELFYIMGNHMVDYAADTLIQSMQSFLDRLRVFK